METQAFSKVERQVTVVALMMVFLLGALDQTIVSTAMPTIIAQLHGLQLYAWVTTAYMLTSTVAVPIWGKLSDLYGRKNVLVAGISLFLFGSCLSGLAGEFGDLPVIGGGMTQLVVFRGIQGLGGGALFTSAFAVIADLYPGRERGKVGGLFGAMFGVASILGPIIGGFFTDHGTVAILGHVIAGWRWVFYVNLPLAGAALFMILVEMPVLPHRGAAGRIDFGGAALLVLGFVPMLLALTWGGQNYPWGSPQILGLLALSAASLIGFAFVERRVRDPLVPLELFSNRTFFTANVAAFILGMSFMGSIAFLPLYMQIGQGVAATRSGLSMLPLMVGVIFAATASGFLVSKTGRYKPPMLVGSVILIAGMWLLSRVGPDTTTLDLAWRLVIVGLGLGPSQSMTSLAVQNAVSRRDLGVATSSSQFFRQIGGVIGVALFGAVLTHSMTGEFSRFAPPGAAGAAAPAFDIGKVREMAMAAPPADGARAADPRAAMMGKMLRVVVSHAVADVFKVSLLLAFLGLVATVFIPGLVVAARKDPTDEVAPVEFG